MKLTKITLNLLIILRSVYCVNCVSDKFFKQITSSRTTECIQSVIQKNFPCGSIMTLVDSKQDGELIQLLNSENYCYSFIVRSYEDGDLFIPTPVYIIRAKDVAEFTEGFLTITNDLFWNPRGRFIIELDTLEQEKVDMVFRILMKHKAYDVILIRKRNKDVVIDTYYPFKDNNCGEILEVATIGNCKDVAQLKWLRNKNISLRNCTVRIAATQALPNFIFKNNHYNENGKQLLGLEQFILETIAEKEGIQLSYMLVEKHIIYGVVLPNHTATGLLANLQKSEVDIAAGGFILIRNRVLLFDYIWGYNYATLKVFTPAAGEEIWKDVYKEFTVETWILILIAYSLVVVVSTMKRRLLLSRSQNQMSISLRLWGYLFLNTSSKLSNDKRFRVIMLFWVWFTFFISNFYNTELYSLLTGRSQILRHISADRLRELPYEPCISLSTRTFYTYAFNTNLPEGWDNPECKTTNASLHYVMTRKNAYAIDIDYMFALNKYKYTDKDGILELDTWSFSTNYVIAMYLTRGFPLKHKFEYYALKMYETGLLSKNLDQIYRIKNRHPPPIHKIHFEKIRLADLRIHFYIHSLGSILSIMCFVMEILWYRYYSFASEVVENNQPNNNRFYKLK